MNGLAKDGVIHFIGIGGRGMSSLAGFLYRLGYNVQGSDNSGYSNVAKLTEMGIRCFDRHDADYVNAVSVVVYTPVIKNDNPELNRAIANGIRVIPRSELLAIITGNFYTIAVSGSHGKTTTASMIVAVLEAAGLDPSFIIGGFSVGYGSNFKVGSGRYLVVEADESDGSMCRLNFNVAVVTNVHNDHLTYYKTMDALRECMTDFINLVKCGGFAVVSVDFNMSRKLDVNVRTFGIKESDYMLKDYVASGTKGMFTVVMRDNTWRDLEMQVLGEHNALNATVAVAVARELGLDEVVIRAGLSNFLGVRRRFTIIGEWNGITFIDDYAHHSNEIRALYKCARSLGAGRIIGVLQPNRFSRVRECGQDFIDIISQFDFLAIMDVYAIGEKEIAGCTSTELCLAVRKSLGDKCLVLNEAEDIATWIKMIAIPSDMVIFIGSGSITCIAASVMALINNGDVYEVVY